jgi:hypothetical protein
VALLLALPLAVVGPSLLGSRTFVPWDLAMFPPAATQLSEAEWQAVVHEDDTDITEIPVMFAPQLRFVRGELAAGRFPHWDPASRAGTNLWASSILGLAYPPNWLVLAHDDPVEGLALGAYLALLVAGLLTYGACVQLGLSPLSSLLGAVVFAFSGTVLFNLHFYQRLDALIWLPGVLWSLLRMARARGRGRIPSALALASCTFLTLTAGFPPYALVVGVVSAAFLACLALGTLWSAGASARESADAVSGSGAAMRVGAGAAFGLVGSAGGAALLGAALAAVQLLPMLEFFPSSNRQISQDAERLARTGFDPYGLVGYLAPAMLGHPHLNEDGKLPYGTSPLTWALQSRTRWDDTALPDGRVEPAGTVFPPEYNFGEYTVFVGVVTLLLVAAGLMSRGPPLRWVLALAAVGLLILASAPPWTREVLERAPFLWVVPTRITGPVCALLAVLAAVGMDALPRLRVGAAHGLAALATVLALACFLGGSWVGEMTGDDLLGHLASGMEARHAHLGPITPETLATFFDPPVAGQRTQLATAQAQVVHGLGRAGWMLLAGAVLFALLPRWRARRHGVTAVRVLALGVITADLLAFGAPLNRGRELVHEVDTPVHAFLREQRDVHASRGGFLVLRAGATLTDPVLPTQLPGGTLLNDGIGDLNAYTFLDRWSHLPLLALYGPRWFGREVWPLAFPDDERLELPLFDLMGVRFVLSTDALDHAGEIVGPEWRAPPGQTWRADGGAFFIHERESAFPRGWVVHQLQILEDEAALIAELTAPTFEPGQRALLEPGPGVAELQEHVTGAPGRTRAVVFEPTGDPDRVRLVVPAGEPGLLVLNLAALPGWSATVNGRETGIQRANLFQTLVPVGAERSQVELTYLTPGFELGAAISAGALAVLAALGVVCLRTRRRADPLPKP